MGHYMKVSELPPSIQKGLGMAGYCRKDVEVCVQETFFTRPPSGRGRRGYVVACRLDDTEECKITWGSFGGSNMFTKTIDDSDESVEIPRDIAFISGMGSGGTGYPASATIYISPKNMNPQLLPPTTNVSEKEAKILGVFKGIKSSYRKEYLERLGATASEIDSLVARGFLSRNKAGATSITTEGRNAAEKSYY